MPVLRRPHEQSEPEVYKIVQPKWEVAAQIGTVCHHKSYFPFQQETLMVNWHLHLNMPAHYFR